VKYALAAVTLIFGALIGACANDDAAPSAPPAPSQPEQGDFGQPPGRPPQTGLARVSLQRVFPELSFDRMTGLYQMPQGRWLVLEQRGRIMTLADGQASVYVDLTDRVNPGGNEEGLLGLALAPDFEQSGEFYVYYSAANPRRGVLSRFQASGNSANPASETVILEVEQPFANHNGGQLKFGPDGYLYLGLGDGGSGNDPQGNGQDPGNLLGSLIRIDVSNGTDGYAIPADNPLVDRQDARDEVYAYGLRNPWRFSWDMETGELWLADVGQNSREEVNLVTAGGNYGWAIMEGFECLGGGTACDMAGLEMPVHDYSLSGPNCAVTGGYVYRGEGIPGLRGAYVFGDYCAGTIWALRHQNGEMTEHDEIASANFRISSFAQDADGEIYAVAHGSSEGIYRLVP
jgi:glucose/arabinose dehydrogenase